MKIRNIKFTPQKFLMVWGLIFGLVALGSVVRGMDITAQCKNEGQISLNGVVYDCAPQND